MTIANRGCCAIARDRIISGYTHRDSIAANRVASNDDANRSGSKPTAKKPSPLRQAIEMSSDGMTCRTIQSGPGNMEEVQIIAFGVDVIRDSPAKGPNIRYVYQHRRIVDSISHLVAVNST